VKIGLALSGGGARGAAHLGVLNVLCRERVPIDLISGTSMGAAVAAYYASDPNLDNLVKKGQDGMAKFIPDGMFKKLPTPQFLWGVLNFFYDDLLLEKLPVPCAIAAFNLKKWKVEILKEGSVKMAVWASCAVPFVVPLPEFNGAKYMDAIMFCQVPVKPLFEMGADVVIASIVPPFPFTFKFISQKFARPPLAPRCTSESEKIVIPIFTMLPGVGGLSFRKAEFCIAKGEESARSSLSRIRNIIPQ